MTIINSLDYQGFQKLQKLCVEFKTNTNPWFESSYPVFVKHPISKIDDIIPLIAYAYSWMPTIPTVKFESLQNDMCLLDELKSLQNGTVCNLNSILGKMIPRSEERRVG